MGQDKMNVVFLHPDLGIGGAERLVVDAALSLKQRGHSVLFYTSHHDPSHCFEETRDGTLTVKVRGDFLPRHVFQKFQILFAMLRSLWAALCIIVESRANTSPKYDVAIVDQVSVSIPLLRLFGFKVVFYCHFPDLMLSKRDSFLKKLYRLPFDMIEQFTTGFSNHILVNSNFTLSVYDEVFPVVKRICRPSILYPSINFDKYDKPQPKSEKETTKMFLSINRFERKKNIGLAVKALIELKRQMSEKEFAPIQLVIAGGYDERVLENKEHYVELKQLATENGLTVSDFPNVSGKVVFLRSFTTEQRSMLLHKCCCVVYTPSNEHFGIVPVEAMYAGCPVIAVNSGGPLESVVDGKTGYLCEPTPAAFAAAYRRILSEDLTAMGQAGHEHVVRKFSLEAFGKSLEGTVKGVAATSGDFLTRLLVLLSLTTVMIMCVFK